MTIGVYDLGEPRRLSVEFTNSNDVDTDPDTVTLQVLRPDGTKGTYLYGESPTLINKSSTGNYYADITFDQVGDWYYQWAGTGAVGVIEPGQLVVKGNGFSA